LRGLEVVAGGRGWSRRSPTRGTSHAARLGPW
jgi:hypothetical protein